jgi:arsenite methyltransferase
MGSRVERGSIGVVESSRQGTTTEGRGGPMADEGRANYGVDSPKMLVVLGVVGVGFAVWAVVVAVTQGVSFALGPFVAAILVLAAAGYMVRSSRVVKPAIWAAHLDGLALKGKERALDVGCGRGLVTVALADRLPRGSVVGVDIWRASDQTGNTRANAEANLELEGVADRVELVDASMDDLPFGDAEFDVVTASLSLHCLPLAKARGKAMNELMRVTKPGGRVVILDTARTFEYEAWLNDGGWADVVRGRGSYAHYPPVRFVTATKPRR